MCRYTPRITKTECLYATIYHGDVCTRSLRRRVVAVRLVGFANNNTAEGDGIK